MKQDSKFSLKLLPSLDKPFLNHLNWSGSGHHHCLHLVCVRNSILHPLFHRISIVVYSPLPQKHLHVRFCEVWLKSSKVYEEAKSPLLTSISLQSQPDRGDSGYKVLPKWYFIGIQKWLRAHLVGKKVSKKSKYKTTAFFFSFEWIFGGDEEGGGWPHSPAHMAIDLIKVTRRFSWYWVNTPFRLGVTRGKAALQMFQGWGESQEEKWENYGRGEEG